MTGDHADQRRRGDHAGFERRRRADTGASHVRAKLAGSFPASRAGVPIRRAGEGARERAADPIVLLIKGIWRPVRPDRVAKAALLKLGVVGIVVAVGGARMI